MNRPVSNVAGSVRARLSNVAKKNGKGFQRILQCHTIERLLVRLAESAHPDHFILKGAMLYFVWVGGAPRETGDLDPLGVGPASPADVPGGTLLQQDSS